MNDWVSAIGALTGVAALVISIMSYRYSKKVDDQNIRLRCDELTNDISIQLEKLPALIKEADRSKIANLAAKGKYHSGTTMAWAQSLSELNSLLDNHRKEYERLLKMDKEKVIQIKKLDRLRKILQEHMNWLNGSLKDDREEVLNRMSKI